jgi:hypothetical protein
MLGLGLISAVLMTARAGGSPPTAPDQVVATRTKAQISEASQTASAPVRGGSTRQAVRGSEGRPGD